MRFFQSGILHFQQNCIIIVGFLLKVNKEVVICNVYAPSIEFDKRDPWKFILYNIQSLKAHWCVGGDFNTVLEPSERVRVGFHMGSNRSFRSFMFQANVIDIPLQGTKFTWSNNRVDEAWVRDIAGQRGRRQVGCFGHKSSGGRVDGQTKTRWPKLLDELWKRLKREEQTWKQKLRINWLMESDRYSKFFYSVGNGRRSRNRIAEVNLEGRKVENLNLISKGVFKFFKNHIQKDS
ncbi:hypothetical protein Ddye_011394 [Dipteronia dyeriana]|uniref:Endonuclease/exonuclease/phosphatase domain-containing protein n=1 Tax=Dipteronia dyeriana TaxID=168575 RepID=A0AAE0CI40_9ROSI|nr:hypothetical protein Ddye_011394 [Dipteronia dyeriana]